MLDSVRNNLILYDCFCNKYTVFGVQTSNSVTNNKTTLDSVRNKKQIIGLCKE